MSILTFRHFQESDVPIRTALLREGRVMANINDDAITRDEDQVAAGQLLTIREQHHIKRMYTACRPDGTVVGFCWLTSIDWRSRSCELSFALLPRYRIGFGSAMIPLAREHIFRELNMAAVVNQVLDHNTMLHPTREQRELSQVSCGHDSYTVGEFRTAHYWSRTAEQCAAEAEGVQRERAARGTRLRAALAGRLPADRADGEAAR